MKNDFKVLVLISGRGSNLKALIDQAVDFRIIAVLSDEPDAKGLKFADEAGIPKHVFHVGKKLLKQAILEKCREISPDLIALAGFMRILQPEFVREFYGKLVNIHPSLLPDLPGLNTHKRAIQAGINKHGCTVHYVDNGVDTGPIIAQSSCAVTPDDTEESLSAKVLALEHRLYPWVVNNIARGQIKLKRDKVWFGDDVKMDVTAYAGN
ncbi:MAG: phosphoribosylglycinamide formyltransferase [Deltaproteobacteria bacterium]|nr:phosphoribosylglycinamide formyltransferase [Deltaproteobacteria bacterium]